MEKLGSSLAFLLKVVFQSLVYTTCWCPSSISRRLQMPRRTLCPLAALCPTEDRKVSGGSAVAPGAADTPSSALLPPDQNECIIANPAFVVYSSVVSFYVPFIVTLLVYIKIYIVLRRRRKRVNTKRSSRAFRANLKAPLKVLRHPLPSRAHPPPSPTGLAHAQLGAGDTGTPRQTAV